MSYFVLLYKVFILAVNTVYSITNILDSILDQYYIHCRTNRAIIGIQKTHQDYDMYLYLVGKCIHGNSATPTLYNR